MYVSQQFDDIYMRKLEIFRGYIRKHEIFQRFSYNVTSCREQYKYYYLLYSAMVFFKLKDLHLDV